MKRCFDVDSLVAVGAAVEWEVEELFDHLLACVQCREQLEQLATVHGALATTELAPEEVVEAVMSEISAHEDAPRSLAGKLTQLMTALLAALTTSFSIALVASGTSSVQVGPVVGAAVVVALATAWWSGRARRVLREPLSG